MTSQEVDAIGLESREMDIGFGTNRGQLDLYMYRRGQGSPTASGISVGGNARWAGSRYLQVTSLCSR